MYYIYGYKFISKFIKFRTNIYIGKWNYTKY